MSSSIIVTTTTTTIVVVKCTDDLISCIQKDASRTKGYINLLQLFLNDQKLIKGSIIENIDTNIYQKISSEMISNNVSTDNEEVIKKPAMFVPYAKQPWSAMGGYFSLDKGSGLLQYGMGGLRGRVRNPTVIYDNFLVNGAPYIPSPEVLKYLTKSGKFGGCV